MFKLSVPAVGDFTCNVFGHALCFTLRFRQLHSYFSVGDAGDGYGSFTFSSHLFRGWRYGCIPVTEDLFAFSGKNPDTHKGAL